MSNVTLFNPSSLPAHLVGRQSTLTDAMNAGFTAGFNRISIRNSRWNAVRGGQVIHVSNEPYIDVVIVDIQPSVGRIFYDSQYVRDQKIKPACFSNDGVTPSDKAERRPVIMMTNGSQRPVTSCAECPNNIRGSGQNGGRACGYTRRIAVVLANDLEGDVYALDIKALSLFGDGNPALHQFSFRGYADWLREPRRDSPNGIPPNALVTRLSFDPNESVPVLRFGPSPGYHGRDSWLTGEEFARIEARRNEQAVRAIMDQSLSESFDDDANSSTPKPVAPAPTVAPVSAPAPVTATVEAVAQSSTPIVTAPPPTPPVAPPPPTPPAPPKQPTVKVLGVDHPDVPQAVRDWAKAPGVTPEMVNGYLQEHYPKSLEPVEVEAPPAPTPPAPPAPPAVSAPGHLGSMEAEVVDKPKRTRKKAEDVQEVSLAPSSSVADAIDVLMDGELDAA